MQMPVQRTDALDYNWHHFSKSSLDSQDAALEAIIEGTASKAGYMTDRTRMCDVYRTSRSIADWLCFDEGEIADYMRNYRKPSQCKVWDAAQAIFNSGKVQMLNGYSALVCGDCDESHSVFLGGCDSPPTCTCPRYVTSVRISKCEHILAAELQADENARKDTGDAPEYEFGESSAMLELDADDLAAVMRFLANEMRQADASGDYYNALSHIRQRVIELRSEIGVNYVK